MHVFPCAYTQPNMQKGAERLNVISNLMVFFTQKAFHTVFYNRAKNWKIGFDKMDIYNFFSAPFED